MQNYLERHIYYSIFATKHKRYHDEKSYYNFLFLLSLACQGQETHKGFLSEGKQWNEHETYVYWNRDEGEDINRITYYSLLLRGDTVVGERDCLKLYYCTESDTVYRCAMYEEETRVYYIPSGSIEPGLLYDFSKSVGEEVNDSDFWPKPYVTNIDYIMVNGENYKRISFTDDDLDGPTVVTWVEGVGSDGGLFGVYSSWHGILVAGNIGGGKWGKMDSCYENGKCVFTNDDFHKEGITEGVGKIVFARNVEQEVYDLQGRRVQTSQRGSLYVKGGKKYIYR